MPGRIMSKSKDEGMVAEVVKKANEQSQRLIRLELENITLKEHNRRLRLKAAGVENELIKTEWDIGRTHEESV